MRRGKLYWRVLRIGVLVFLVVWNTLIGIVMKATYPPLLGNELPYAPIWALGGLVLFLIAWFALRGRFVSRRARRWVCGALLVVGLFAYIAISTFRAKYFLVAGAGWGGILFGVVAVVPLGSETT